MVAQKDQGIDHEAVAIEERLHGGHDPASHQSGCNQAGIGVLPVDHQLLYRGGQHHQVAEQSTEAALHENLQKNIMGMIVFVLPQPIDLAGLSDTIAKGRAGENIFDGHVPDFRAPGEAQTLVEYALNEKREHILKPIEHHGKEQSHAGQHGGGAVKQRLPAPLIEKQQKNQWELEKKLDHLAHCKDQTESLKQVLAENDRIREEITAIDLALETMTGLSATIRDSFGLYLNKTASELISGITGGIYDSMSVDESLNVFMNTRTRLVPVEQVSSGTMDQIYLALRLAAARLIQPEGDYMPLIFDDSFVLYDEDRLRTALKWLKKAYPGQIIIFTCHQREAQMMTAEQIAYRLVTM